MIGAEDGGHQVAAEGGTGPSHVAALLVDVQAGAVGGQAGLQAAADTGAQIAAVVGGADEHAGGAVLLHQSAQGDGVSVSGVVGVLGAVHHDHLVSAVLRGSLHSLVHAAADDHGHQGAALLAGHHLTRSQQLNANVLGGAVLIGLNKYPEILGLSFHCDRPLP